MVMKPTTGTQCPTLIRKAARFRMCATLHIATVRVKHPIQSVLRLLRETPNGHVTDVTFRTLDSSA